MPIDKLYVRNFRGIRDQTEVAIKPITVFVGENSSGKSSCIHALACMSQTVKIISDGRPLILDDEFANVHLGRFIEVIHSKSYSDTMELGVGLKDVKIEEFVLEKDPSDQRRRSLKSQTVAGDLDARYAFKCSKRTQEISVEAAEVAIGKPLATIRRTSGGRYSVTALERFKCSLLSDEAFGQGFLLDVSIWPTRVDSPQDAFTALNAVQQAQQHLQSALGNTYYLGPFRQPPARRYPSRGASPREVGPLGELAITMLANESVQTRARPHLNEIASWLVHMGLAKSIEVSRIGSQDLFNVVLVLKDGTRFPLADLGYGLSQVLPVLTQCSFAQRGSTLLFEQPELHVHPLATKGLCKVFVDTAIKKDINICIETHSVDLVQSFFGQVKSGALKKEQLQIYTVRRVDKRTTLNAIDIDDDGVTDHNWKHELCFVSE